jgi:hypothetical protein
LFISSKTNDFMKEMLYTTINILLLFFLNTCNEPGDIKFEQSLFELRQKAKEAREEYIAHEKMELSEKIKDKLSESQDFLEEYYPFVISTKEEDPVKKFNLIKNYQGDLKEMRKLIFKTGKKDWEILKIEIKQIIKALEYELHNN